MNLNDYNWRPITFQGETFPATLMAISVVESLVEIQDEDVADWLWRLPICCGFLKKTASTRCVKCAQAAIDLLLENREVLIRGIQDRLVDHGFGSNQTYSDWLVSLQRIAELSASAHEECFWSALSHPNDVLRSESDVKNLLDAIGRMRPSSE